MKKYLTTANEFITNRSYEAGLFIHTQALLISVWLIVLLSVTANTWAQKTTPSLPLSDSVYWVSISTDSGVVHAAVAMPEGTGPFPAIIILHGTHGFAQEYVQLSKRFAAKGFIGIAACWFAGRKGPDQRFITPIDFVDAPPFLDVGAGRFRLARQTIDSVIEKVVDMTKIQKGRLALMGHARGAGACLDYVRTHPGRVQALILNSCGYPPEVTEGVAEINVPVLMLHGTADNPSDGTPFHDIELARRFEEALKEAKKDVEVKYYEASDINGLFTNSSQFDDTVERVSNFLQRKFKK
jgi:dienelactone hydrolase